MALCTENFQTRETVVTRTTCRGVRDEKCPLSRYLVPWITLKFVQEASLFFSKRRETERPVGPSSPPSRVREGSYVRVLNVVLDRAKNVRAIRKSHTWMRGDSRCSIYVTCNWPSENSPLSYGTADRIRRRRDYNFQEEGLLEAFSKEQVPVNSIASRISFAEYFLQRFEEFLLFNTSFLIGRSCSWITRGGGYWFRCDSICICIPWSPSSIRSMRTENCSFDSSRSCCRCCCACSGGGGWDVILSVEICRKQSVMV